jgi:hypothetical protein
LWRDDLEAADGHAERYEQAGRSDDAAEERRGTGRPREAARTSRSHVEEWVELAAGQSRRPLAWNPVSGAPHDRPRRRRQVSRRAEPVSGKTCSLVPQLLGSGQGRSVWSPVVASCLGVREVRSGSRHRSLEGHASLSRCSTCDLVNRVVMSQFSLRLVRQPPEKADVGVGHVRVPGSGAGIGTATAWGSSMGRSSGPRRRKPKALSRLVIC